MATLGVYPRANRVRKLADDPQAHAVAVGGTMASGQVFFTQVGLAHRGHADTGITHFQPAALPLSTHAEQHGAALRVPNRVADQIVDDALQ